MHGMRSVKIMASISLNNFCTWVDVCVYVCVVSGDASCLLMESGYGLRSEK